MCGVEATCSRLFQDGGRKANRLLAQPHLAPLNDSCIYARPDDLSDSGVPWRQVLLEHNREGKNLLGLCQAYRLYKDPVYQRLYEDDCRLRKLYILSAGWGLISRRFPDAVLRHHLFSDETGSEIQAETQGRSI